MFILSELEKLGQSLNDVLKNLKETNNKMEKFLKSEEEKSMNKKEIIGFKALEEKEEKDYVCPYCGNETLCIPIKVYDIGIFSSNKTYTKYTCDKCGCIWRVKQ